MKKVLVYLITCMTILSVASCEKIDPAHKQEKETFSIDTVGFESQIYFSCNQMEVQYELKFLTNSDNTVNWSFKDNEYVSAEFTKPGFRKCSVTLSSKVQEEFQTTLTFYGQVGSATDTVDLTAKFVALEFAESDDPFIVETGKRQSVTYHIRSNLDGAEFAALEVSYVLADDTRSEDYKLNPDDQTITLVAPENNWYEDVEHQLTISFPKTGSSITRNIKQGRYGSTRSALMSLFYSMGGEETWGDYYHWGDISVPLKEWGGILYDGWKYQSDCDEGFVPYHLAVTSGTVNGTFPEEFFELDELEGIFLTANYGFITGDLPSRISNCKNLKAFQIEDRLTIYSYDETKEFRVCNELWDLPELWKIRLNSYAYPGLIKFDGNYAVNHLKDIYEFAFYGCNMGGSVTFPQSFYTNNSKLGVLRVQHCKDFYWDISYLINFRYLRYFEMNGDTHVYGQFPESIGELTLLSKFSLGGKKEVTGQLAESIGNLKEIIDLRIYNCSLSGTLPNRIGDLETLTHLNLSFNEFTGQIPPSIGNLTELQQLYLSYNHLTGELPETMLQIKAIQDKTMTLEDLFYNIAIQREETTGNIYFLPCPEWVKKHYGVSGWPEW